MPQHPTHWFVTRHPGAREWAKNQRLCIDRWVTHLDLDAIQPGDVVMGSLPVNLAAEVCSRGGEYHHLCLLLEANQRGQELSAHDLENQGAHLRRYSVWPEHSRLRAGSK